MKTHLAKTPVRGGIPRRLVGLFLVPLWVAFARAELPNLRIGVDSVVLTWAPSEDECIVVGADSPDGPWTPVPVPIQRVGPYYQAVVKCSVQQKYYRLAKGTCFVEEFQYGLSEGWTVHYLSSTAEEALNLEYGGGHLRLTCTDPGEPAPAIFERDGLVAGDFALSIDILDWNPDSTDRLIVSPYANLEFDGLDPSQAKVHLCGWTIFAPDRQGDSALWIMRWETESNWRNLFTPLQFAQQRRGHAYRLIVTGVGNTLTIRLFNRDTGRLIREATAWESSPLPPGTVGFTVYGARDGTGTIDVTLDNFIAVVIPPE